MDIRMPVLDGIAATAEICADPALAETRVLILTTFEEDEYLVAALRAGASGFIGKGAEPDEIAFAVRAVHAGDALLSPAATRTLITRYVLPSRPVAQPETFADELAQLTEREREVLLLVARGRSNQEIADELVISPHTAKTHVNRVMAKVQAHDRAQLVILAYESGLLAPGEY
jgi:DNA-binding NarL/FixJ family response regulator